MTHPKEARPGLVRAQGEELEVWFPSHDFASGGGSFFVLYEYKYTFFSFFSLALATDCTC